MTEDGQPTNRVVSATLRDVRSVFDMAVRLPLGDAVTVLVGPHRSGSTTVLFAIAAGLDATIRFIPERDLPRERGGAPQVTFATVDGTDITVAWDPHRGTRSETAQITNSVVYATVTETPRDLVRRLLGAKPSNVLRRQLAAELLTTIRRVIPEATTVDIGEDGTVIVRDEIGVALPIVVVRALAAIACARFLGMNQRLGALCLEAPEAFLHPAAQEAVAALLVETARQADAPVIVATSSPFVLPRTASTMVVALARDVDGRTQVTGRARGDKPQAPLLGGLLPDPGIAGVLDRIADIGNDTQAVLIVEGGTDEAYLVLLAERLGRPEVLANTSVVAAGGAMAAALEAILLRAETHVPVFVLLDHDSAGRRARDTLVSRFGFARQVSVITYADVIDGGPPGVEAETLFDQQVLRRFVAQHGPSSTTGERVQDGVTTVELTSTGKAAFVRWLDEQQDLGDLSRWDRLFVLLEERVARADRSAG
jgi:5S rRNA maturation endonuclease (ribonuclease M5)